MRWRTTSGINSSFPELSPSLRQVAYVLRTRSPLSHPRIATLLFSLDLHVLTTPPAFTLSQNQTLRKIFFKIFWKFNVCIVFQLFDSLDLYFKVVCQKNFWLVRTIVLSKFQRTSSLPSMSFIRSPFPEWKSLPLRRNIFSMSRVFLSFFQLFSEPSRIRFQPPSLMGKTAHSAYRQSTVKNFFYFFSFPASDRTRPIASKSAERTDFRTGSKGWKFFCLFRVRPCGWGIKTVGQELNEGLLERKK